ncbi:MAG: hypothetical protein ACOYXT_11080 [Bacteroidota bacterium]
MGKDKKGKFQSPAGKTSGISRRQAAGIVTVDPKLYEHYPEIADKYTVGDDEVAANVRVRHPNRNVDKAKEKKVNKNADKANQVNVENKRNKVTEVNKVNHGYEGNEGDEGDEIREVYEGNTSNKTRNDDKVASKIVEPGKLTDELFAELAEYRAPCCMAAFMPTHRSGAEVNEQMDAIAFKNILQRATTYLSEKGYSQATIQKLLAPGYELLRNEGFWYNLSNGMALFMADDFFRLIKMPMTPKEELLINTTFYVTPLIPIITARDYFYLLVLSKKQARLYQADAFSMDYIPVPELPHGVEDVVHFEEKDDQKLRRTGSGGAGGGAIYHGIGAGKPDDKANLSMYFDEVDETLWSEVLHQEHVPLLLAGVEYLIPLYKEVAKYNNIWREALSGNHEYDDQRSLYEMARKIMEPYFRHRAEKAREMYGNYSSSGLTSSDPLEVIPAAYYRRVWYLFVLKGEHIWGKFDEQNNKIEIHDKREEGDECLLDRAMIKTILNRGDVFILEKGQMPEGVTVAAIMRYQYSE